jgi:hypothetical protein
VRIKVLSERPPILKSELKPRLLDRRLKFIEETVDFFFFYQLQNEQTILKSAGNVVFREISFKATAGAHTFLIRNFMFQKGDECRDLLIKMPFHGQLVVIRRSGADGSIFPLVNEVRTRTYTVVSYCTIFVYYTPQFVLYRSFL